MQRKLLWFVAYFSKETMALTLEYKTKTAMHLSFRIDDGQLLSAFEYIEANAFLEAELVRIIGQMDLMDEQISELSLTTHVDKVDEITVDYRKGIMVCNQRKARLVKDLAKLLQLDCVVRVDYHKPRRFK